MLVGHRWEYQYNYRGFKCVGLPLFGVESHQWCIGCGCLISDKELYESKLPIDTLCFLNLSLDILASRKNQEPIEAGTFQEFLLLQRRDNN